MLPRWIRAVPRTLLVALIGTPATALEWTVGQPIGPSLEPMGSAVVVFQDSPWLFVAAGGGIVYKKAGPGAWQSLAAAADTAPAAVVHGAKVHLFVRDPHTSAVRRWTFDGSQWVGPSGPLAVSPTPPAAVSNGKALHLLFRTGLGTVMYKPIGTEGAPETALPGRTTLLAPAAAFFDGRRYVVITRPDGGLAYRTFPSGSWEDLGEVHTTDPPSLAVSGGRLFVFVRDSRGAIVYRILDRSHGRNDWLPVDRWMPAGEGFAETPPAAAAMGQELLLTFRRNRVLPGPGGLTRSRPALYFKRTAWTDIPIAVIRGADSTCSNPASDANVDTWIRYANSTWAPLLVRFSRDLTMIKCGSQWQTGTWNDAANESELDADSSLDGKVWVVVRGPDSSAFAGYEKRIVEMPEGLDVCDSGGPASLSFYNNQLAHELGHYFGLAHTFHDDPFAANDGVVPETKAVVEQMLAAEGFDPVAALDKDHADTSVRDTAPDPHYEVGQVSPDKCTVAGAPVFLAGPSGGVACSDATACVDPETCESGICQVRLVPPRLNVMSYYQVSATVINVLTAGQGREAYRQIRKRGFAPGETEAIAVP